MKPKNRVNMLKHLSSSFAGAAPGCHAPNYMGGTGNYKEIKTSGFSAHDHGIAERQ